MDDKREFRRISSFLDVQWESATGKYEARTSEIGFGGCFIDTIGKVDVGETISFKICQPSGEWIELQGEVVYELPRIGFGVKFKNFSAESIKKIVELVKSQQ
jgi:hypothetical protein